MDLAVRFDQSLIHPYISKCFPEHFQGNISRPQDYRYVFCKSTIVDSRPIFTCPPSMIISMASPRSSATCPAVVGLGLPEVLALGAATYPPAARISSCAIGSLGKRTATLSSPPVVSFGTISALGGSLSADPASISQPVFWLFQESP